MADRYWVGGTGTWDGTSTANWAITSGGAAGASAPTISDNAIFDTNSGTLATVSVSSTAKANDCTINKSDITLSLIGNVTFNGACILTTGTLLLNTYTLTTTIFSSNNSNTRTINFGTGNITVNRPGGGSIYNTAVVTGLTVLGEPVVNVSTNTTSNVNIIVGSLTEANAISFNFTTGSYSTNFLVTQDYTVKNVDFTGFSGTWLAVAPTVRIFGNLTLSSSMTITPSATGSLIFQASSGPKTIAMNGNTLDFAVEFFGAGGSWTCLDNFTIGATRTFTMTNGTFNANNKNVTIGSFALKAGTKTLTLGSGTWTVAGANWNANTNSTNFTVNPSTATINMTSSSAKIFAGGGFAWPTLNQGGAGALTVQQSNTFTNITNTVQPATLTLTSGTTQTVTDFDASGTAGNLITLNASTPGSRATLTDSGGVNSVSYVDIKDIAATGYGEWQAYTSNGNVDSGNNVGWVFAAPPPLTASEYQISFKSFTERRSF